MKCFACLPESHENPYPDHAVTLQDVELQSDLVLLRTREALINREDGSDVYLVGAPFSVTWERDVGFGGSITVPAGFITDLTSVPPVFRLFVSRAGPWLEAAVVHDYLYIAWQLVDGRGPRDLDRKFADDIMFEVMKAAKVSAWRRWAIFAALRLAGRWTYQEDDGGIANFGDLDDARLEHLAALPQPDRADVV